MNESLNKRTGQKDHSQNDRSDTFDNSEGGWASTTLTTITVTALRAVRWIVLLQGVHVDGMAGFGRD